MDPQTLLFIVIMSAAGGLCAYVADILGYKIGKKRISFKRIRPKYVARTSVVVAGMLIPLITIGIILIFSSDYRAWLTKGQRAVEELQKASEELDRVNKQRVNAQGEIVKLTNARRVMEGELSKRQTEIGKRDTQIKSQLASLKNLQGTISNLKDASASLKNKVASTQEAYSKAVSSYEEAKKNLEKTNADYQQAKARGDQAKQRFDETVQKNLELTNANVGLEKANSDLQKKLDELQKQFSGLTQEIESLKTAKASAEADTKKALADFEEAKKETNTLVNRIRDLREEAKQLLQESVTFTRYNTISFVYGEELGRVEIPSGQSVSSARTIYRNLIRKGRAVASERGAKPDGQYPFSGTAGIILSDDLGRPLSEDEVEAYWVRQMLNQRDNQVLVMTSATNRFASEPITLKLEFHPNPIVFRKGEIVAESRIDGRASDVVIRSTIREFLKTFVNTKARSRKMIPIQTRDGETYGQFTEDQYFDAFATVKKTPRLIRIVAVAQADIRAGDPLAIDLEFR